MNVRIIYLARAWPQKVGQPVIGKKCLSYLGVTCHDKLMKVTPMPIWYDMINAQTMQSNWQVYKTDCFDTRVWNYVFLKVFSCSTQAKVIAHFREGDYLKLSPFWSRKIPFFPKGEGTVTIWASNFVQFFPILNCPLCFASLCSALLLTLQLWKEKKILAFLQRMFKLTIHQFFSAPTFGTVCVV